MPITVLNAFALPTDGDGITDDGINLWVTHPSANHVFKVQTDGTLLGDFATGDFGGFGSRVYFDGSDIWCNGNGIGADKLTLAGAVLGNFVVDDAGALTSIGANLFVQSNSIFFPATATRMVILDRASGANLGIFLVADNGCSLYSWVPVGTSVWTTDNEAEAPGFTSHLIEIDQSGAVLNSFNTATNVGGMCFAFGFFWMTDLTNNLVLKYNAAGALLGSFGAGGGGLPVSIASDGTYLWVANYADHTVSVLTTAGILLGNISPAPGVNNIRMLYSFAGSMWLCGGVAGSSTLFQMKFTGPAALAGRFHGTHVGFLSGGGFGGGNE